MQILHHFKAPLGEVDDYIYQVGSTWQGSLFSEGSQGQVVQHHKEISFGLTNWVFHF